MANPTGFLAVNVTTATGAFPISGADVVISAETETGERIVFRTVTDLSGRIRDVELGSKDVSYSLTSTPDGVPFSLYNVTVNKGGFYPGVSLNIRIFPGITSVQPINLIPFTATSDIGSDEFTPRNPPYDNKTGMITEEV